MNLAALFALLLALGSVLAVAACTAAQTTQLVQAASTPTGQLFCSLETAGGGTMVVGLINAEASAKAPSVAPVAVIATNAAKSAVDAACAQAAANTNSKAGIAVSPPAGAASVPLVAVTVPS